MKLPNILHSFVYEDLNALAVNAMTFMHTAQNSLTLRCFPCASVPCIPSYCSDLGYLWGNCIMVCHWTSLFVIRKGKEGKGFTLPHCLVLIPHRNGSSYWNTVPVKVSRKFLALVLLLEGDRAGASWWIPAETCTCSAVVSNMYFFLELRFKNSYISERVCSY